MPPAADAKAPKDFLVSPAQFGFVPEALWKFPENEDWHDPKRAAAYQQHVIACRVRDQITKKYDGKYSPSRFALDADIKDTSGFSKKIEGARPALPQDYLLWSYHLGLRILPDSRHGDYTSREELFVPIKLREVPGRPRNFE